MAAWYYARGGQQVGPVSEAQLRALINQGALQPTDLVWRDGMAQWQPVSQVADLAGPAPVSYYNPQAGMRSGGTPPPTYLVQAILVTLCCCLPFGIVSIVQAAQVSSLYQAGDYNGAMVKSESAKKWSLVGFICGLIANTIWIGVQILAAASK